MDNPWEILSGSQQPTGNSQSPWEILSSSGQPSTGLPSLSQPTNWGQFTQTAKEMAKQSNFPASVLLGQAALESGRGTSNFAQNRNNYFGYQAYDSSPDSAKKYPDMTASINDYINLIKNTPRYRGAYQQYLIDRDPVKLLQGIKNAGYATDPNYVAKVMATPEFRGGD